MSKSRKWRKAVLEWLKEMWRSCVGCNMKSGKWAPTFPPEILAPCLAGILFLACCLTLAIFFAFSILQIVTSL